MWNLSIIAVVMFRSRLAAFALPGLLVIAGCGPRPLPTNAAPPKDRAELEARYEMLHTGTPEAEIAAFLGKAGAGIAGYSTSPIKRKPEGGNAMPAAGEFDKNWASADGTCAIRVVFRADGKARLIEILRMTPMGPVPRPAEEAKEP